MMSWTKTREDKHSTATMVAVVACAVGVCICTAAIVGLIGQMTELIRMAVSGIL